MRLKVSKNDTSPSALVEEAQTFSLFLGAKENSKIFPKRLHSARRLLLKYLKCFHPIALHILV